MNRRDVKDAKKINHKDTEDTEKRIGNQETTTLPG